MGAETPLLHYVTTAGAGLLRVPCEQSLRQDLVQVIWGPTPGRIHEGVEEMRKRGGRGNEGGYMIELVVTMGKWRSILLGPSEKPVECPSEGHLYLPAPTFYG